MHRESEGDVEGKRGKRPFWLFKIDESPSMSG
jgi:hypothetical protein